MTKSENKKLKIGRSLLILVVIVVILPAISWFYLQKGLSARKAQLEQLNSLGKISDFYAYNEEGRSVTPNQSNGILIISHGKLACAEKHNQSLKEYVGKFINQDVFYHVILGKHCEGWSRSYFADTVNNEALFTQFEQILNKNEINHNVLIVDREGEIRRKYDVNTREDLELLVTHSTILMPPLKKGR